MEAAVRLRRATVEEMFAHARECAPAECCGLLGGRGAEAESVYRLRNAARDPAVAYDNLVDARPANLLAREDGLLRVKPFRPDSSLGVATRSAR